MATDLVASETLGEAGSLLDSLLPHKGEWKVNLPRQTGRDYVAPA